MPGKHEMRLNLNATRRFEKRLPVLIAEAVVLARCGVKSGVHSQLLQFLLHLDRLGVEVERVGIAGGEKRGPAELVWP